MKNAQLEMAHAVSNQILDTAFEIWHKLVFREVIGITAATSVAYSNYDIIAIALLADLLNVIDVINPIPMPIYIPNKIDKDQFVNFANVKLHRLQNISTVGYTTGEVVEIAHAMKMIIEDDMSKSRTVVTDFVPYKIMAPTIEIDAITMMPVLDINMTYCYRLDTGRLVHPLLLDRV